MNDLVEHLRQARREEDLAMAESFLAHAQARLTAAAERGEGDEALFFRVTELLEKVRGVRVREFVRHGRDEPKDGWKEALAGAVGVLELKVAEMGAEEK